MEWMDVIMQIERLPGLSPTNPGRQAGTFEPKQAKMPLSTPHSLGSRKGVGHGVSGIPVLLLHDRSYSIALKSYTALLTIHKRH
jgi:hypothetical protein